MRFHEGSHKEAVTHICLQGAFRNELREHFSPLWLMKMLISKLSCCTTVVVFFQQVAEYLCWGLGGRQEGLDRG